MINDLSVCSHAVVLRKPKAVTVMLAIHAFDACAKKLSGFVCFVSNGDVFKKN